MATGKNKDIDLKDIAILVDGCRRGSKSDWAELIERLTPVIFAVCYRFHLTREESFDLFGKVSLKILEKIDTIVEPAGIFRYVSTTAYREATSIKNRARLFQGNSDGQFFGAVDNSILPPEAMELEGDLDIMSRSFARLSKECRDLLQLLFLEPGSPSYRDISQRTGLPVSSIGPVRGRCLDRLRKFMIKEGYED